MKIEYIDSLQFEADAFDYLLGYCNENIDFEIEEIEGLRGDNLQSLINRVYEGGLIEFVKYAKEFHKIED